MGMMGFHNYLLMCQPVCLITTTTLYGRDFSVGEETKTKDIVNNNERKKKHF